ncbi:hypothetical protein HO173_006845 [Letharia columbiana]|uniref:Uncharacterized protein n=1 Tax=Letharia columbiana TaxID=112416 RepID=A0A8H6FUE4_9LECA|nr:uncharacterized protein HO173_006845 [Letharia columbiana]KAF6234915.1 hypothetical protein HO173_006845 [Letharia columbiana]
MNVSQSIFTAPDSFNSKQSRESTSPTLGKRLRNSSTPRPSTHTGLRDSTSEHAGATQTTSESIKSAHSAPWNSNHRSDLCSDPLFASASKKRASSRVSPHLSTAGGPPPSKKQDIRHRSRLDLHSVGLGRHPSDDSFAPAPLFLQNQPQQRPNLPYRLSSSEAGARMLSKASKEDTGGVRTLKLARGSVSLGSPARPLAPRTPSGSGRSYLGTSSKSAKSPDSGGKHSAVQILNQVGVIELLEQDERPTFILNLGEQSNYEPGPLKIVFANASLRASPLALEMISGRAGQVSPGLTATTAFSDFKAWSMSYVKDHESLDVALPSFFYAGATWTSCSLRKRFRVIKSNPDSAEAGLVSSPPSIGFPANSSLGKEGEVFVVTPIDRVQEVEEEPQDYFGNARVSVSVDDHRSSTGIRRSGPSGQKSEPGRRQQQNQKADMRSGRHDLPIRSTSKPDSVTSSPQISRNSEAILRAACAGDLDYFVHPQNEPGFFDWTRLPNSPALPRHIQFTRSIDWASTPLGPIEEWAPELRSMCNLIMASPHPAAMYWGPDLIAIYNEAYILLAGQKHPKLMGQSYRDAWPEIWDSVEGVFQNAITTGQATMKDDDCLFIQRAFEQGHLEETYFSWSIIPLVGSDGSVVGLYNPAFEKTRRKVAERRMLTLREIGEKTTSARDLKSFWQQCLRGLEYNEHDSPFVLLYSITDDPDSDSSSMHSKSSVGIKQCVLEGSLGIPNGHPAATPVIDLRNGSEYFARVFREATKGDRPIFLSVEDGTLDAEYLEGIEWRGFGDPCTAAVCCPVHLTGGESTMGFLVMGVNPRRPYDDDYSLYVQLLSRQLATAMASVVLFEEEIARGRRAARLAAQDRIELSEQLAARTQEAVESETKFTRMAELAPVGIFIADSKGKIAYCNEKWYEISGVPKDLDGTDEWMYSVKDEDKETLRKLWSDLVHNAVPLNAEIRFKTTWIDQNGNKGDTWALASAFPERGADGRVKVIFGSITDISQQKWAEHFEKRRMEEAVEMKRQQENFIDITSHEMRNPLSAILQCADEITTSMTDLQGSNLSQGAVGELVQNAIDASGIIALCAQHQKRIVDDILTLSKLDSALLLVTPCDVMPKTVVQRALKMFDGEVHTADIKLNFKIDESIEKFGIEWVKLDPSRLLQVLINLTTNAIKFTTTQEKRIINVTLAASLERPSKDGSIVSYFPPRSKKKDVTKSPDWGTGEKVYLHFAVQDTGRGLTDDEKKLLFIRFSQASPRTHVQYGGSGLGLFISRELVELQGGEIGVASRAGEGSTFAFYIKARRSTAPKDDVDQFPGAGAPKPSTVKPVMPTSLNGVAQSSQTSQTSLSQKLVPKGTLKILIVEDNLVNQKVLSKQLRNMGCIVHVANHGGECLERLKESTFWKGNERDGLEINVILMDQEMPVMDGLTCTKEIRKLEEKGDVVGHVPIIAVTANARSEQIDAAMDVGMDDVVSKPFRIVDLIPKVEGLTEKYLYPIKGATRS